MNVTLQEEDFGLEESLREIKHRSKGKSFEEISKIGSARVLKTAMHYAPSASATEMKTRSRMHAAQRRGLTRVGSMSNGAGRITVNVGRRNSAVGRVWRLSENAKWILVLDSGFKKTGHHLSDAQWLSVKDQIEIYRAVERSLTATDKPSRGLVKNSFWQGLEALNINHHLVPPRYVKYSNFVKNARASNGRVYRNGGIEVLVTNDSVLVTYTNTLPYAPTSAGMIKYIIDAVATTRKGLESDIENGVFENYKTLERRWPILVTK